MSKRIMMSPTDVTPWYQEPQSGRIPSRSFSNGVMGPLQMAQNTWVSLQFYQPYIQVEFQLITLLKTGSWAHFARSPRNPAELESVLWEFSGGRNKPYSRSF